MNILSLSTAVGLLKNIRETNLTTDKLIHYNNTSTYKKQQHQQRHNTRNISKQEHIHDDGRYRHNRQFKQSMKAVHQPVMNTQSIRAEITQLPTLPQKQRSSTQTVHLFSKCQIN